MTTNIYDQNQGLMATDSRWSVNFGEYVVYLDDTGFEKIELTDTAAFMFAGNGKYIHDWKEWIRSNPVDDSNQPAVDGVCICIADRITKLMRSFGKENVVLHGGYFAGSGTLYAIPCWMTNKDPKMSVETAKKSDIYSGGEVKFCDLASSNHNLNYPQALVSIHAVNEAIVNRGLVMKNSTNGAQVLPFPLAAQSIPELEEIKTKIASGELSANAPCDGMYKEWSADDKQQLKVALGQVFGWKNK